MYLLEISVYAGGLPETSNSFGIVDTFILCKLSLHYQEDNGNVF